MEQKWKWKVVGGGDGGMVVGRGVGLKVAGEGYVLWGWRTETSCSRLPGPGPSPHCSLKPFFLRFAPTFTSRVSL